MAVRTMAISSQPLQPPSTTKRPGTTARFEWMMGSYMLLLCLGSSLDNWAHFHGKVDQSFFTPWHAVLYGMMATLGIALGVTAVTNIKKGYTWRHALPPGYMLSLLGVGLFIAAGVLDLCWHLKFGIEFDTAAYISPPHLLLLCSGILAGTGPVRSAWCRLRPSEARGWFVLGPMLLSMASAVAALAMFTVFATPMVDTFSAKATPSATVAFTTMSYSGESSANVAGRDVSGIEQALGVADVVVQTVLIMSALLLMLRTWMLPFGAVTLLIGLPSALQAIMADNYWLIAGVVVTGLIADAALTIRKSPLKGAQLYAAGFCIPALYMILMFATISLTGGLAWPPTLLAGSTLYAAVTGLFLAFLLDWPLRYRAEV